MFQKRTLGIVFSLLILLPGCGQKKALYLPSEKPQAKQAPLKQQIKQKLEQTEEKKLPEQDAVMP